VAGYGIGRAGYAISDEIGSAVDRVETRENIMLRADWYRHEIGAIGIMVEGVGYPNPFCSHRAV
jgi:hypothetical protein